MRKTLIRTAVIASLLTALTVSAVAYFAMPRPTVAQDGDQGVTLQPPAIQPANSSQSHPALVHRAGYAPRPSATTVARSYPGEPVSHQRSTGKSVAIVAGSAGAGAAIGALAGGGKGAAIGAASGGVAGFIYDRMTHNK